MELKISEIQQIQPVSFNFEELKKELIEKSEHYKTAVYTEETITVAKQDRANLNKLVKAVNDEKIRVKNKILEPYTEFETQCKELMEIVKSATENIDTQIKDFEQKKKDEKLEIITNYFGEKVGIYKSLISFDLIFNERWLNVTYDLKQVQADIDHIIAKTKTDLMTIDNIVKNEETNAQARDFYFRNINNPSVLGESLNEAKRIEATKANLAEMKKQQEEAEKAKQTIIPKQEQPEQSVKVYELCFRTYMTKEQMFKLKEFFTASRTDISSGFPNAAPTRIPARERDFENVCITTRLSYLFISSILENSAKSTYASSIITITSLLFSSIYSINSRLSSFPVGAFGFGIIIPPFSFI